MALAKKSRVQLLEQTDWVEIGGTLYQVEKPVEFNDFGNVVVHFRPNPEKAASIMLIADHGTPVDVHEVL